MIALGEQQELLHTSFSPALLIKLLQQWTKPWAPLRQNVAMEPRANANAIILTNVAGGMPSDMSAICGKLGQLLQSLKLEAGSLRVEG